MKNLKNILLPLLMLALFAITLHSCQKEIASATKPDTNHLNVYLTDAPVNFDHVFIDIKTVEVKVEKDSCSGSAHHNSSTDDHGNNSTGDDHGADNSDDCEVWDTLQVTAAVYDLLQFRNGIDALLASGNIPAGEIKAIRVTLGANNSVVVDSASYPLALSGNNKIIIAIDDVERPGSGNLQLHLDFDLGNSIVHFNNNRFEFHPYIKPFNENKSGRVGGRVLPADAKAIVLLTGNLDTLTALPEKDGRFKIRGIRSAQFDLHIKATAGGYGDTIISNMSIYPGQEIKLNTVTLHR